VTVLLPICVRGLSWQQVWLGVSAQRQRLGHSSHHVSHVVGWCQGRLYAVGFVGSQRQACNGLFHKGMGRGGYGHSDTALC
jgi:hypothetical protein